MTALFIILFILSVLALLFILFSYKEIVTLTLAIIIGVPLILIINLIKYFFLVIYLIKINYNIY